jgi:hypothetical protein
MRKLNFTILVAVSFFLVVVPAFAFGKTLNNNLLIGNNYKGLRIISPTNGQQLVAGETATVVLSSKLPYLPFKPQLFINGVSFGAFTRVTSAKYTKTFVVPASAQNLSLTVGTSAGVAVTDPVSIASLDVLYDKLGTPGNWGFAGQDSAYCIYEDLDELNEFDVTTAFRGTLTAPQTIKRIELAGLYYNFLTKAPYNLNLLSQCKLKVWNENIYSFSTHATNASLSTFSLGGFNFGSSNSPISVEQVGGVPQNIYLVGWDNLNIALSSNTPLEISIQCGESLNNSFDIMRSTLSGPDMIEASKRFGGIQQNFPLQNRLAVRFTGKSN